MRKSTGYITFPVFAFALWACAGTPGPGEAGYPFNLSGTYDGQIVVDGTPFGASLDLQTRAGGALEGSYEVNDPVTMSGPVTGSVVADSVEFALEYMNPMDGCGGVLDATGAVEEGGSALSGRVRVNDSCGGYLTGTFSLQR